MLLYIHNIRTNVFIRKMIKADSVTRKESPNVYKSCPKMISLEKLNILTPLQKLPKNVVNLGKFIVAKGLKRCPKSNKSPYPVTLKADNLTIAPLKLKNECFAELITRPHAVG